MFCKVNIMLFSSLLNMITASLGRWVGGSVGQWSVVGWSVVRGSVLAGFNKTLFKTPACDLKLFQSYPKP